MYEILQHGIETRGRDKGMLGLSFSSQKGFPFYHQIGCFVQYKNPNAVDANQNKIQGSQLA